MGNRLSKLYTRTGDDAPQGLAAASVSQKIMRA